MQTFVKVGVAILIVVILLVGLGVVGALSSTSTTSTHQINSTTSQISSVSITQTTSSSNSLYFQVSCDRCSGPVITNTSACSFGGYVTSLLSWDRSRIQENQYAGQYDISSAGSSAPLAMTLYGNGTQQYSVSIGYKGQLLDWTFEHFTCYGTMTVSLLSSNGTIIWSGSTNSSYAYVIGSLPT